MYRRYVFGIKVGSHSYNFKIVYMQMLFSVNDSFYIVTLSVNLWMSPFHCNLA